MEKSSDFGSTNIPTAEELENPTPPVQQPLPRPTQAEVTKAIAEDVARRGNERLWQSMSQPRVDFTKVTKTRKYFEPAPPTPEEEKEALQRKALKAAKLNGYKKRYAGRISFNFRKTAYTAQVPESQMDSDIAEIELLVNTMNVPAHMKDLFIEFSKLVELSLVVFGLPAEELTDEIEASVQEGEFDQEFEQLALEWASWLNRPTEQRLLGKFLLKVSNVMRGKRTSRSAKPAFDEEELRRESEDL